MPDPDQFMTTLEMISVFETSFTPEQREQLAQRRAALGPEAVEAAKTEWAGLVEELLRHVQDGTPVDDPRVRALVGRWDALANGFHSEGDDGERTKAAAQRTWEENSEEIGRSLPWPADRMRDLRRLPGAGPAGRIAAADGGRGAGDASPAVTGGLDRWGVIPCRRRSRA